MPSRYDHLTKEELLRLLEARDRRDAETRFGLVWEANEIERDKALNGDFVALDLDPKLSCGPGPWRNLIVEGDNFDALRHLRMCFAGQVKCIYIDPPYNTGNRDFVYNDRFVDKEDSWRHSKWCEFMFQRLMIARDLLRQDGVIFVSIDDNEMPTLAFLMKRIFGEGNFVATFVWERKRKASNLDKQVRAITEYVICYRQSKPVPLVAKEDVAEENKPYPFYNTGNKRAVLRFPASVVVTTSLPDGSYPAGDFPDKKTLVKLLDDVVVKSGVITTPFALEGEWRYSQSFLDELIREGERIEIKGIRFKPYWINNNDRQKLFKTLLTKDTYDVGTNEDGNAEIAKILGANGFSFPKPTSLIAKLVEVSTGPDDLVLDFFAGSGTTAHAVHKLNAADGGRRRVILVSSTEATKDVPDKNLCRDVCATRVRRVIEGYTPAGGEPAPGLGGDFAYLRTRRIPAARLLEIDHAQVWTALQLMHGLALEPYTNGPFAWAGDEDEAVMFLPRFRREDAPVLLRQLKRSAAVALYSWQPSAVEQHVRAGHVTHLQIPETLSRRFGLGQGGKR